MEKQFPDFKRQVREDLFLSLKQKLFIGYYLDGISVNNKLIVYAIITFVNVF
jgi:hypothetical protein